MAQIHAISILLLLFCISCNDKYIKYNPSTPVEIGSIKEKSPTLVYSYTVNKETILLSKDEAGVKTYYKLSTEETAPFLEAFKNTINQSLNLPVLSEPVLQKTKIYSNLDPIEDETVLKIWNSPLYMKEKQIHLIPEILQQAGAEQLLLAKIDYSLTEKKPPEDKSVLNASLEILIFDKRGKLIFASQKKKSILTYLPDDDISVANFMGDVLSATFKGKVNVKVNKHCRPQLHDMIKELWSEMGKDIKKKIN